MPFKDFVISLGCALKGNLLLFIVLVVIFFQLLSHHDLVCQSSEVFHFIPTFCFLCLKYNYKDLPFNYCVALIF